MEIVDYLRGKPSFYSREAALAVIRSLTGEDASSYYAELESSKFYEDMKSRNDYLAGRKLGNIPIETEAKFLYGLVRATKPDLVVETGPGAGISSSFILRGLDENDRGAMWSIEAEALRIKPLGLVRAIRARESTRQMAPLNGREQKNPTESLEPT